MVQAGLKNSLINERGVAQSGGYVPMEIMTECFWRAIADGKTAFAYEGQF